MFIKILLLSIVSGAVVLNAPITIDKTIKYDEVVTTESINQRNFRYSDWLNSYTEVTYKYETNEVNSIDDLVVGNIYHFNSTVDLSSSIIKITYASAIYSDIDNFKINLGVDSYGSLLRVYSTQRSDFPFTANAYLDNTYNSTYFFNNGFEFVYLSDFNHDLIQYVSSSNFNIIESVTYHQPSTIIGYLNEFLETNLLNEIPYIRDINFNIGGQNINLMTWVIMAFGFILVGMLFYFLVRLIIWLFKLFSNSFLLR